MDLYQDHDWKCIKENMRSKTIHEKDRVFFYFLAGLNAEFDQLKGRLLSTELFEGGLWCNMERGKQADHPDEQSQQRKINLGLCQIWEHFPWLNGILTEGMMITTDFGVIIAKNHATQEMHTRNFMGNCNDGKRETKWAAIKAIATAFKLSLISKRIRIDNVGYPNLLFSERNNLNIFISSWSQIIPLLTTSTANAAQASNFCTTLYQKFKIEPLDHWFLGLRSYDRFFKKRFLICSMFKTTKDINIRFWRFGEPLPCFISDSWMALLYCFHNSGADDFLSSAAGKGSIIISKNLVINSILHM